MWIISEEQSINLDNIWRIAYGINFYFNNTSLIFEFENNNKAVFDCITFENAKEMLKEINQAIYDGKKTFNFDAHLNYIEKRRKNND